MNHDRLVRLGLSIHASNYFVHGIIRESNATHSNIMRSGRNMRPTAYSATTQAGDVHRRLDMKDTVNEGNDLVLCRLRHKTPPRERRRPFLSLRCLRQEQAYR